MILTGSTDGSIYVWQSSGEKVGKPIETGSASIQTISVFPMNKSSDIVFVGGKENNLMALTCTKGQLNMIWNIEVGSKPRSVDFFNEKILLGLKNGSIVEMPMSQDGNSVQNTVMSSHCDGEVWGL